MSKDKNNQILEIAFFIREPEWIYSISNKLNDAQKKKYFKSPLVYLSFSISIKISFLRRFVDRVNLEMHEVNKILKKDNKEVSYCLKTNKAYVFKEIHHIYTILALVEVILIEMKSIIDLIIRYIVEFYKYIFQDKKRKSEIWKELKTNGIDTGWIELLDKIRNDFIHQYSSWIKFKKLNDTFEFLIVIPESLRKKFKKECLFRGKESFFPVNIDFFNADIYINSRKFGEEIINQLRIYEKRKQDFEFSFLSIYGNCKKYFYGNSEHQELQELINASEELKKIK
ncbi:MAG: hypothetical protein ACE5KE_01045, partial [Methanosarcinales archaeon]